MTCHAIDCAREIPEQLLMCGRHWAMVPGNLQRLVWKHYRRGQEAGKKLLSAGYLAAARAAIRSVAEQERQRANAAKQQHTLDLV